jgi:tripartite-type tricarboxylate transporter receptor subunit TctC
MAILRSMVFAAVLVGLLGGSSVSAHAQAFPTGPVSFVVPFGPGGSIDVTLRAMAPKLQERLGKPVLIENRPGGGGVVATAQVAKSPPDGHTLLAAPSLLAANPKLYKSLAFDTVKDLQMVQLMFHTPLVLVVNPDLPVKSIPELIELLKQKPGEITFGHGGLGSSMHLAAELFQSMTGTKMTAVGYRGAPMALNDVMAGHIALVLADTGTVMAQIATGKVRALGVSSTVRVPAVPNIPPIAKAGVPGFDAVGWAMLAVPSATPKPAVERLQAELKAVIAMPEIAELVVRLGTIPVDTPPPDELQKFLATEIERWGDIIERAGVAKSH